MNAGFLLLAAFLALLISPLSRGQGIQPQNLAVCRPINLGETTNEISFRNIIGGDFSPIFIAEGDSLTPLVNIRCLGEGSILRLNLDFGITAATDGSSGGGSILLELNNRRFTPDENVPFDELIHELVAAGGITSSTNFKNIGLLIEAGYRPVYLGFDWLKLGEQPKRVSWANIGAFVQAGYATSFQTSEVEATQGSEEASDSSGALLRLKIGGESEVQLPVPLPNGLRFRLLPEGWAWYDVLSNRLYGRIEGTLRLETGSNIYYDVLSVKHGSAPSDFTPGTQFSSGLTIRF